MSIVKKIRKMGNSLGIPIPTEVLELLDIDASNVKYYYRQDDNGKVYISVLSPNIRKIEEKKFVKTGSTWGVIIPSPLVNLWNLKCGIEMEIILNRKNLSELQIIPLIVQ